MRKDITNAEPERKESAQKKSGIGTMDVILVIVGIAVFLFTVVMICVFLKYAAIPDTLCQCFFAATTGECGVMGIIKVFKEKYKEREWAKEDKQAAAQETKNKAEPETDLPRNNM